MIYLERSFMKKRIKIFVIAFLFIISWALHTKVMAATTKCQSVSENNIRYVNATFANINYEEYNALQRGGVCHNRLGFHGHLQRYIFGRNLIVAVRAAVAD